MKSLNDANLMAYRVTQKQKRRLLRVRQILKNRFELDVEVLCVFVMPEEIFSVVITEE